jgi:very-short-patch-repair endonuclease
MVEEAGNRTMRTPSGISDKPRRPTERARSLRNALTPAERALWLHLRARQLGGAKFSRQMPIGPFICDFLCRSAGLVVELDGGQHGWRTDEDARRAAYLEAQGYRVIRFWNDDVIERIEGVLLRVGEALALCPPPAPPASGRGVE